MTRTLPVFRGYTVDLRARQFRKMRRGKPPEFIKFEDKKGEKLLGEWMITQLDAFVAEVEYYQRIQKPLDSDICFAAAQLHQFKRKAIAGDLLLTPQDIELLKLMGVDLSV